jgi:GNAT superfamily N-acetyltransferase
MTPRAEIRPATTADVPGIAAILAANGEPLEQPDVAGHPYLEFLLGRGRVAVAEAAGVIVGFGSVIRVGDASMVSDLFVEPAHHGQGIGSALLTATLAGVDRREDFAYYAMRPEADAFVVRDGDALAAIGWAARDDEGHGRALSHATIARDADPAAAVCALFAAAARGESVWGCVPGPHPALPALLEAGARIVDRDTYCTSDPGWLDPERILPNPSLL